MRPCYERQNLSKSRRWCSHDTDVPWDEDVPWEARLLVWEWMESFINCRVMTLLRGSVD